MTTGERLVSISTLSTGTAMDHLMNIENIVVIPTDATDYMETGLLNLLFMNNDFKNIGDQGGIKASDIAGNWYVALFKSSPGETGDQSEEATYGGYQRVPIERATQWEIKSNMAKNIPMLIYPPCSSGSEILTHFGIADSLYGGNICYYGELPEAIEVKQGDSIQFEYNMLSVAVF